MRRLFSYMPIVAVAVLFSLFSCQSKKGEKQSGDVRLPEISVAYPAVDSVVLIKSYPGYLTSLQTVDLSFASVLFSVSNRSTVAPRIWTPIDVSDTSTMFNTAPAGDMSAPS